jgi:hypothetical protein
MLKIKPKTSIYLKIPPGWWGRIRLLPLPAYTIYPLGTTLALYAKKIVLKFRNNNFL